MSIAESRHREVLYQQLSGEVMREAHDLDTLASVCARALNHPEVARDPQLHAMLRAFASEREAEIRQRIAEQRQEEAAQAGAAMQSSRPTEDQLRRRIERFRLELDDRLAHYDLAAARETLERIAALHEQYPQAVSEGALGRCRMDLARVEKRRAAFCAEIDELEKSVVAAAQSGAHDLAAKALSRLTSINASQPGLLSDARLRAIRSAIAESGEAHEHREAGRKLIERERAVASEIKGLAAAVHEFHRVARGPHPDEAQFRAAEAKYRQAVQSLRQHDNAWLADLMVELEDMLEALHDPTGRASEQVAKFLESVKSALLHVSQEIRQIAAERSEALRSAPAATDPLVNPAPMSTSLRTPPAGG